MLDSFKETKDCDAIRSQKTGHKIKQINKEKQSTDHHPSKNANTAVPVTHINSVQPMERCVWDAVK